MTLRASRVFLLSAAALLLSGLTACEGLGDGNKIEKIEIFPVNTTGGEVTSPYRLYECLRDQFSLIATFTDGTRANFSGRATWTSSDSTKVKVSNGDIPFVFVVNGEFKSDTPQNYAPGVLVPVKPTTDGSIETPVTITAEFIGLSAEMKVVVRTPQEFRIAPAPNAAPLLVEPTDVNFIGRSTFQRFNLLANLDGRWVLGTTLTAGTGLNPLLWRFSGDIGIDTEFVADDPDDPNDFNRYVTPVAPADPVASINSGGTVFGLAADSTPREIQARFSLCENPTDTDLAPAATVQITEAPVQIILEHEDGFSGNPSDLVDDTNELLKVLAELDTGSGTVNQDITSQATFGIADSITGEPSARFIATGGALRTFTATGSRQADVSACFPVCVPTHASLEGNVTSGNAPLDVTFTVSAFNSTSEPVITEQTCTFDFGDSSGPEPPQSCGDPASHTYMADGQYTATVRVEDSTGAQSANTGAVQIVVGAVPPENTPPTAQLTVTTPSGLAPHAVTFNAAASSDPDAGDAVTVYEFDLGNGVVIRQTSASLTYTYLEAPGSAPSVAVYDKFGAKSDPVVTTNVEITGTSPPLLRSDALSINAVAATLNTVTLCPEDKLQPDLSCTGSNTAQPAFDYPGRQFEAIGSFTANALTDADGNPVPNAFTGMPLQKITRFVIWRARPPAVSDVLSDLVSMFNGADAYHGPGQVNYLRHPVAPPESVSITATPSTQFGTDVEAPAAATLEVGVCANPGC